MLAQAQPLPVIWKEVRRMQTYYVIVLLCTLLAW